MRTATIVISALCTGWTGKATLTTYVRGPFQPEKSLLLWAEQPAVGALLTVFFLVMLVTTLLRYPNQEK